MQHVGVSRAVVTVNKVVYGKPYVQAVLHQVKSRNSQVLLAVSETLDTKTTVVRDLETALREEGRLCGKYSGMRPHSPDTDVLALAQRFRETGADTIVSLGGGSLTDGVKGVKVVQGYKLRKPEDFKKVQTLGRGQVFCNLDPSFCSEVKVINVPTTLSAGEFSCIAGVKSSIKDRKFGYIHPELAADVVILDPKVTVHTPDWLFLSTGVRAVDHCIETLCSVDGNIFSRTTASKALALLAKGLPASTQAAERASGTPNMKARQRCQLGTWLSMCGICQQVPVGASHAIGHVLGSHGVPHGYTSCVMLPHVLKYNEEKISRKVREKIVSAFGQDLARTTAHDVVYEFLNKLGMPQTLKEVGIQRDQFKEIARHSMKENWIKTNPKPMTAVDVEKMLERVFDSKL